MSKLHLSKPPPLSGLIASVNSTSSPWYVPIAPLCIKDLCPLLSCKPPPLHPLPLSSCTPNVPLPVRSEVQNYVQKLPSHKPVPLPARQPSSIDVVASTVQLQDPLNAQHVHIPVQHVHIPVQRPVLPENKNLLETAEPQIVQKVRKVSSISQSNTGTDSSNPGVSNPIKETEPVSGSSGRIRVRKFAYLPPYIDNPEGLRTKSNSGSSLDHPNPVIEAMDISSQPSRSSSQIEQSFSGSCSELKDNTYAYLARVISELRDERIRIEENEKILKEIKNRDELNNIYENGEEDEYDNSNENEEEEEYDNNNENEDEDQDKMEKEEKKNKSLNSSEYTEAEDNKDNKLGIKTS